MARITVLSIQLVLPFVKTFWELRKINSLWKYAIDSQYNEEQCLVGVSSSREHNEKKTQDYSNWMQFKCCKFVPDSMANIHTLDLSFCQGVTDVSMLGTVHTLNLWNCRGVTDVSMLGSVHTLDIWNCPGVADVSMLGSVHILISK